MTLPIGVIIYAHEDIPCQRVPYMTDGELVNAFEDAVKSGFPQEKLVPYVQACRTDLADEMFRIMDEHLGERYSIYKLTAENLERVLGDFRVCI